MIPETLGENEIAQLTKIVRQAGAILLELWPGSTQSTSALGVEQKNDGTPVSIADFRSNEFLCESLQDLYPGDALLSEESAFDKDELRKASKIWIVDPLDGTNAFLQGRDDFSVLVSRWSNGKPEIGFMFFPARQQLVFAHKDSGVFCNETSIRVSTSLQCRNQRVYIRNFESTSPLLASPPMDSGLAFFKVANGELDGAVVRMVTHREWDLAAPIVAILEAGGKVSDENGNAIVCGNGDIPYRYFVASNGNCHSELLRLIP